MITTQLISAILGITIAGMIIVLIRRDHLHTRHALWWLMLATTIAILGFFPNLIDTVGLWLNIKYPPTLLFILGLSMLLIKVLSLDIQQSHQERQLRRLIQKIALLETELKHYRSNNDH
ncbi:MAG: hypothetical protein RIT27_915 [Pseudomonadota bacterium]|jgi:hypothetical protein